MDSYFRTRRWVFDPKALRTSRKAAGIIGGAYDFVERTATIENGMDIDPDSWAAILILDRTRKAVATDFDRLNAIAAKR